MQRFSLNLMHDLEKKLIKRKMNLKKREKTDNNPYGGGASLWERKGWSCLLDLHAIQSCIHTYCSKNRSSPPLPLPVFVMSWPPSLTIFDPPPLITWSHCRSNRAQLDFFSEKGFSILFRQKRWYTFVYKISLTFLFLWLIIKNTTLSKLVSKEINWRI